MYGAVCLWRVRVRASEDYPFGTMLKALFSTLLLAVQSSDDCVDDAGTSYCATAAEGWPLRAAHDPQTVQTNMQGLPSPSFADSSW